MGINRLREKTVASPARTIPRFGVTQIITMKKIRNWLWRASPILLSIWLAGCASAPGAAYHGLTPIKPELGDVYLYRGSAIAAYGQAFNVKLDEKFVSRIYNASYVLMRLKPGTYDLSVAPTGVAVTSHRKITVEAGQRSFYEYDFVTGPLANTFFIGSSIEPREQSRAEADMKPLRAAQSNLADELGTMASGMTAQKKVTKAKPAKKAKAVDDAGKVVAEMPPPVFVRRAKPIFSQLVQANFPQGYGVVQVQDRSRYIERYTPPNEGEERWTRMMTVSGARALASKPGYSSARVAADFQERFRDACPASYSGKTLSDGEVNGTEVNVSVFACGSHATETGVAAETTLLIVLKGERDFYTVQWAERGAPSETPLKLDLPAWIKRYRELGPVRLCPMVEGEKAPYPSCS